MNPQEGSTRADIVAHIDRLKADALFFSNLIAHGCGNCRHYAGRGCSLAGYIEPPPEVKAAGCPSWAWDGVPF
jgi:hypothetical protein